MQIQVDWRKVTTVFLDMDGTLLDLHFDNYFWHEHVPLRYGEKHSINPGHAKRLLQARYKSKAGTLDWYCTDFWSKELGLDIVSLKQEISHRIQIFPKVRQFLGYLRNTDKRIVLTTNAHRASIDLKVGHFQLASYFDKIVSSHDFGCPKEELLFWNKLMQVEPHDPASTLCIDDNLAVLATAEVYGIRHLITIKQPDSSRPAKETLHYRAISDFSQIMPPIS